MAHFISLIFFSLGITGNGWNTATSIWHINNRWHIISYIILPSFETTLLKPLFVLKNIKDPTWTYTLYISSSFQWHWFVYLMCQSHSGLVGSLWASQWPAESISLGMRLSNHALQCNQTLMCCVNPSECCSSPTSGLWLSLCSSLWGPNPDSDTPHTGQRADGRTTGDLLAHWKPKANIAAGRGDWCWQVELWWGGKEGGGGDSDGKCCQKSPL